MLIGNHLSKTGTGLGVGRKDRCGLGIGQGNAENVLVIRLCMAENVDILEQLGVCGLGQPQQGNGRIHAGSIAAVHSQRHLINPVILHSIHNAPVVSAHGVVVQGIGIGGGEVGDENQRRIPGRGSG